jgi:hypothetical protein
MIHRDEARLRALFRLLLASAAATTAACSSTDDGGGNAKGGADASASADATVASHPDAGDGGAIVPIVDGGSTDASADGTSAVDAAADAGPDARDVYGFVDAACDPVYLPDAGDGGICDFFMLLPCGLPPGTQTEVCNLLVSQCGVLCSAFPTQNRACGVSECLNVDASSIPNVTPLTLDCATGEPTCGPGVGRRPRGLAPSRPACAEDAVGATLAAIAHLEAASVHAFRRLGGELASMRAPQALVRQAERAARDEIRHARITARLARRRGAKPAAVVVAPHRPAPSVVDFAVENAVEGCVREGFGALVATRQASRASDRAIAGAMDRIARDETRHAALAWSIARWLTPRLDAAGRARVRAAMEGAIASLHDEVGRTPADVAGELGLPLGDEARALVEGFGAACLASLAA